MSKLQFGSEEAMQEANIGALQGHAARGGIREAFGEHLVEVIAHLGLELEPAIRGDRESTAQSRKIGFCL